MQFHGDESPAFCASFGLPFMKAIRVRPDLDLKAELSRFSNGSAILLDSYDKHMAGGTGTAFDWTIAQRCVAESASKIVLAGGLDPANVAGAIRQVKPYAVDVSGGVEQAKGIKDAAKIEAFMRAVKQAWEAAVAGIALETYAKEHRELAQSLAFFGDGKNG